MSNKKISALSGLDTIAAADEFAVVDKSDLTDGVDGTSKKVTRTVVLGDLASVTASSSELNTLDGITASTAELNILDGVTATAAELNALDGITATVTELNYTDGVTSAIQTQLDAKAPTASPTFTGTVTIPTPFTIGAVSMTSTAAELNKLDGASANVTAANLNILTDGSSYTALHFHSTVRAMGNALSATQNTNNASKPAYTENNGTTQDDVTLDYDAASDEYDEWEIAIPPGITITSATLYIAYRMASATTNEVVWFCSHNGVADGETWDEAYAATDTFTADTVPDATTKMAIASKALTTAAWAAGDSLRLRVGRDADNGSDDAAGDAKLAWWLLEIK